MWQDLKHDLSNMEFDTSKKKRSTNKNRIL